MNIAIHPTINASLNLTAALFLIYGFKAIKSGDRELHKRMMIGALLASSLFLFSYICYHITSEGPTKYDGQGLLRIVYFTILITHTPLATLIIPFCIAAVVFAFKGKFKSHVRITKWLFPVWMYVSVTGVLIYLMLYVF